MKKQWITLAAFLGLVSFPFNLTWAAHPDSEKPMHSGMSMQHCNQMMLQKLGTVDKNYDHRFIDEMIMHHQGAIDMARNALKNSQRPEIQQTAQKIISDQNKEIEQLKTWRKQWYGE